jgi:hypothetical protein
MDVKLYLLTGTVVGAIVLAVLQAILPVKWSEWLGTATLVYICLGLLALLILG